MFSLYKIVLALHVISIICWMAGILYLYRLLVYHAQETESLVKSRFEVMEMRLYRYITVPAMLASLVFGTLLLYFNPGLFKFAWMHSKLTLVVLLIGSTHAAKSLMKKLAAGTNTRSHKFFRVLNEVPTLLMIAIVFLVILKPF